MAESKSLDHDGRRAERVNANKPTEACTRHPGSISSHDFFFLTKCS